MLSRRVGEFIADELGLPDAELPPHTTLLSLGVDGDDAVDLLESFAEAFAVDLSQFEFTRHFGPECSATPRSLLRWLVWMMFRRHKLTWEEQIGLEPVSLTDLVRAAERGRWTYE